MDPDPNGESSTEVPCFLMLDVEITLIFVARWVPFRYCWAVELILDWRLVISTNVCKRHQRLWTFRCCNPWCGLLVFRFSEAVLLDPPDTTNKVGIVSRNERPCPCSPDGFLEVGTYELLFYCEDEDLTSQVIFAAHSDAELDPIFWQLGSEVHRVSVNRCQSIQRATPQPYFRLDWTIISSMWKANQNCFCWLIPLHFSAWHHIIISSYHHIW